MSIGLDDFDSHTFALAIENPTTALLTVHAPGFPVYLFISKLIQLIVGDTRLALTLMSAICGALGIVLVAKIAVLASGRKAGFVSAGLLLFLPGYWINSELALSDIPGITFTLLAVFLFLRAQEKGTSIDFIAGCFVAGLSLGVRPHNALPIVFAGLWAIIKMRRFDRVSFQKLLVGSIAGILAISLWLIPIFYTFNGLDGYFNRLDSHREHIQTSDSVFQSEIDSAALQLRVQAYIEGWTHLLAGGDNRAIIPILLLLIMGLIKIPFHNRYTWFVALWFIAEASKVFLLASLERPRLFLPALIPLIIWVAIGYSNWRGRYRWLQGGAFLLIIYFLWQALPLVVGLTQIPPPPEQATSYIREYYPHSDDAIVVSQGSFRASQYHLKDYAQLYTPYFRADEWSQTIANNQPEFLIVLDGDDIAPEIFDTLLSDFNYVTIDDRVFERDSRIFPQHTTVRLQVFTQEQNLKPDQLVLPESGQIEVGNPRDGKYFGEGWYRTEEIDGASGRWASQTALIRVTLEQKDTKLRFVASPYLPDQTVSIKFNDVLVDTVTIDSIWGTYEVTIPADYIQSGINTITLEHAKAEYPENHNRRLAVAYRNIYFN